MTETEAKKMSDYETITIKRPRGMPTEQETLTMIINQNILILKELNQVRHHLKKLEKAK